MYAVVPAHNEGSSVGAVVQALVASRALAGVVVVDDGSADDTAARAEAAGALVVRLSRNVGKGEAMLTGVASLEDLGDTDDRVMFVDADLVGLSPEHAQSLAVLSERGYDMVSMLRDRSWVENAVQMFAPLITGERVVKKWVLDELPDTCWNGYSIETAMNDVVARNHGRSAIITAQGVRPRTKMQKIGALRGLYGHWKMAKQILRTRKALRLSQGQSCHVEHV